MATSVILDFKLLRNNICFLHYYLLLLLGNSNVTGQEPPPKIQSFLWLPKEEDLHVISPRSLSAEEDIGATQTGTSLCSSLCKVL